MSTCANCGKPNGFWSRGDVCKCESDTIDKVLKVASAFGYITSAVEIAKSAGKITRYVNGEKTDEPAPYDYD